MQFFFSDVLRRVSGTLNSSGSLSSGEENLTPETVDDQVFSESGPFGSQVTGYSCRDESMGPNSRN